MSSEKKNVEAPTTHGSCLCRGIQFDISGDPWWAAICHCDNCQKFTGTAFGTNLFFKQPQLTTYDPHTLLSWFEDTLTTSGKPIHRGFCSKCGSTLFVKPTPLKGKEKEPIMIVASGAVDGIHEKGGKWRPVVEGFCEPWKRDWLPGTFEGVRRFEGPFRFKL